MTLTDSERFDVKWSEDAAGCWIWTANATPGGYGLFKVATGLSGGRQAYAHRWAYERANGPIPAGLELDHVCNVVRCVNPAHLEPVTRRENERRKRMRQGRYGRSTDSKRRTVWGRGFTVSPGQGSAF